MGGLTESMVVKTWRDLLFSGTALAIESGEPIKVIYPGRINDERGGDFRDAVVIIGGGLEKGDIEVHVRSSAWVSHKHHHDPAYNRVILHVVMWHDSKTATSLQNGKSIPILALGNHVNGGTKWPLNLPLPCLEVTKRLPPVTVAGLLDSAGEERFLARVAGFRQDMAREGAGQSLYRGIMGALGYSRNKLPFLKLADRLPLRILESIAQSEVMDDECLARQQALLLGTAGLLPCQRRDGHYQVGLDDLYVERLERLWVYPNQSGEMSPADWHIFKVRPNNSPVRRIMAMSYLVLRYRDKGLLEGLVNIVRGVPLSRSHQLEDGLLVTAGADGTGNFSSGMGKSVRNPALLGRRRAADIVVNVLLPFTSAWSQFSCQPGLERQAADLYRCYPGLATNSIEGHMKDQLGLTGSLVNSAMRQQGLLHIYHTLCIQGRCHRCRLSQLEAGHNIKV